MIWLPEARKAIERIPVFVRPMAVKGIEKYAQEQGIAEITPEVVERAKAKYLGKTHEEEPEIERIAIVRCDIVSEVCPGVGCLKAFHERRVKFEQYGPKTQLLGFFTCGGCPGRRAGRLAEKVKNYGVTTIHMSSCMFYDGDYVRCPHKGEIKRVLEAKGLKVVEGTHK